MRKFSNARRNRAHFNEIEIKFASEFNEITMSNEIVLVYSGFLFSIVFCFVFVILLYILLYLRFIIFPCFAEEERESWDRGIIWVLRWSLFRFCFQMQNS